jgi:predicted RNA-binding protein YlqC (UPF0109 family)
VIELIEFVAKKLVDHPEDVQVRCIDTEEGQQYELHVNNEDMGRVIGREGRTAKALRTLVNTAAAKAEVEANLEIVD